MTPSEREIKAALIRLRVSFLVRQRHRTRWARVTVGRRCF